MIETVEYKHSKPHMIVALAGHLIKNQWPVEVSMDCATVCVELGQVPDAWVKHLGKAASKRLNRDLKRMRKDG